MTPEQIGDLLIAGALVVVVLVYDQLFMQGRDRE